MKKHIVKRRGHTEEFDERKLYASIFNALTVVRVQTADAELIAEKVAKYVKDWLTSKHEVTSKDILHKAAKELESFNDDAAYLYLHHRSVS